jgi:hypothetical protein
VPWWIASQIIPWFATYVLVARCDRHWPRGVATFFVHAGLAVGIGSGLSSCTYFLWLFFCGPPAATYRLVELAGFMIAGVLGTLKSGGLRPSPPRATGTQQAPLVVQTSRLIYRWLGGRLHHKQHAGSFSCRPLSAFFIAAGSVALLGMIGVYRSKPLGNWDAWAIWGQRARFLTRAGEHWRDAFLPLFAHPDYPLLLPITSVRACCYLGTESAWMPWLLGSLFAFATVTVLTAGLCRLRSTSQGLLAGLVLLGTAAFLREGAGQCADVPLSFFVLSSVLLLALADGSDRPQRGLIFLSGLTAGLGAWTKNEGLLLVLVAPVAWCLAARLSGRNAPRRELLAWAAGVLPLLAVVALFKCSLAHGNDLVEGQSWAATWPRLVDPNRYWLIVTGLASAGWHVGKVFTVVLPLCWLLLGPARRRPGGSIGLYTAAGVLVLMTAGDCLVYLTTPQDLQWHLISSADRLLLQLLPAGLLAWFLYLAAPEEVLAENSEVR